MAILVTEDADTAKVVHFARLGSIGVELASVLVREAWHQPFAIRKQGVAYAGLTPSSHAIDDRQRDQSIPQAGNLLLRRTTNESARLRLRYQPDSGRARWFVERVRGDLVRSGRP